MQMRINKRLYDIDTLGAEVPCRYCGYASEGLFFYSHENYHGNSICPKCKKSITTFVDDGKQEYIQVTNQFLTDVKKIKKSAMYFFKKVAK